MGGGMCALHALGVTGCVGGEPACPGGGGVLQILGEGGCCMSWGGGAAYPQGCVYGGGWGCGM